jgi:hypothetical protein
MPCPTTAGRSGRTTTCSNCPCALGRRPPPYLRLHSQGSVQAPLTLVGQHRYLEEQPTRLYVLGMIYGVLLVMLVYNLFIYLSVRDTSYLYYILIASFGRTGVGQRRGARLFLAGQPVVGQCRDALFIGAPGCSAASSPAFSATGPTQPLASTACCWR